jgi:hypothetical protein
MTTHVKRPTTRTPGRKVKTRRTDKERERLLAKMTPERRALYERIIARREEIGPVDFDSVQAIRELRDDA